MVRVKLTVDLVPLFSGFYVGYQHSQGISPAPYQDLALFGPTVVNTAACPLVMLAQRKWMNWTIELIKRESQPGGILKGEQKIKVNKFVPKYEQLVSEHLTDEKIAKKTLETTVRSGLTTGAGYLLGYLTGTILYK